MGHDRVQVVLFTFTTKEWRKGMSHWTGPPCYLGSYLLQKNGGEGCHTGQDLAVFNLISYRRMGEQDVIADRTFSIILAIFQSCDGTESFTGSVGGWWGCSVGNEYDTLI